MAPRKGKSKERMIVRGRDAENGQFIPVEEAKQRKKEAIVDRMKVKPKKKK